MRHLFFLCFLSVSAVAQETAAQGVSLLTGSGLGTARGGFITIKADPNEAQGGSLFIGRAASGLFADPPAHEPEYVDEPVLTLRGTAVERVRALISEAESRRDGYDAVQHGARIRPAKRPTHMTLGEIYQWIAETPGQPHAIGRYQFIPKTLSRVAARIGARPEQLFSPALQDQLADVLLAEAGWHRFQAGALSQTAFMNNLAKIWAGLPNSTGKSHYAGFAGNKAAMSWARFRNEMSRIAAG